MFAPHSVINDVGWLFVMSGFFITYLSLSLCQNLTEVITNTSVRSQSEKMSRRSSKGFTFSDKRGTFNMAKSADNAKSKTENIIDVELQNSVCELEPSVYQ
eukprot:Pgem_evm1s8531